MKAPQQFDSGLNENHVRHVATTFRYLDELLAKAERIMASAGSASPFQEYADDTTPLQRKVAHDYVAQIRDLMTRHLDELRIPRPAPVAGALWAARTAVTFAEISVTELESSRLGGYGELSDQAAQKVDSVVAELRAAIARLDAYLARSADGDLGLRLQRIEKASDQARRLRQLERVITGRGLVEFRQTLSMLLDRLEHQTFEVSVFGRVSSGKSSLLNHLLDGDYLPVGVTPVTAVPTRITFGERPQVIVEFADGARNVVELRHLADFAAEQQNPGNAKHVSRIQVEVPAPRLRAGIIFVDTPGLGSLATDGAAETAAYLPRADLGIVLVDAASSVTHEDLRVLEAILHGGATAMVLLSKADLLNSQDRARAVDYVRQQVRSQLNTELPVHPVSVVGTDGTLCDAWFEAQLRPLLDNHRELAASSLNRKIAGLRAAVLATLKRSEQLQTAYCPSGEQAPVQDALSQLRSIPQMLGTAGKELLEETRGLPASWDRIIETAATKLAASWFETKTREVNAAIWVTQSVTQTMVEAAAKARGRLEQVRQRLTEVFHTALRVTSLPPTALLDLPKPTGLPTPDASAVAAGLALHCPGFFALLGRRGLAHHFRTKLREQAGSVLETSLNEFSRRLAEWAKSALAEMGTAASANAGILESQFKRQPPCDGTPANDESLREDILLLERLGDEA